MQTKQGKLTKVDNFQDYKIRNVALVLRIGHKRVFTVTERNGLVGFPGIAMLFRFAQRLASQFHKNAV